MNDRGDVRSWCKAAVERVATAEARRVPQFEVAARCYQVWWSLRPGQIPARSDLDPLRFGAELLPHLTIIDVLHPERDYRWRLCGEQAIAAIGTPLRGKRLQDLEHDLGEAILFREALDEVVRTRQPLFYVLRHHTLQGLLRRSYGVLLPLLATGHETGPETGPAATTPSAGITHILGAFDWATGE